MIARRVAAVLAVLVCNGCLQNLNQEKYFDKLYAADPALAERVDRHRDAIEEQLGTFLREQAPPGVTEIGYWGATWDLVREVTDGEQLYMRGRIFHENGPASTYFLAFTVADDGTVDIREGRVFAARRGPR